MKMIAGACLRAVSKSLRMREAPTPANISTNAEAGCEKKAAPDSRGDRLGEQRLARAGRAVQQHAARDARTEALEARRVAQELDDLRELGLGLLDARDVVPAHDRVGLGLQLGRRGARHHLHEPPHQVHEEPEQQRREPEQEERPELRSASPRELAIVAVSTSSSVGRNPAWTPDLSDWFGTVRRRARGAGSAGSRAPPSRPAGRRARPRRP